MKFRESTVTQWRSSLVVGLMTASAPAQPCDPEWSDRFYAVDLDTSVSAMANFDDGKVPTVYAAGVFRTDGLKALSRIARWDGAEWQPLGEGLAADQYTPNGQALCTFDDGNGPALYVGGRFERAGGQPAGAIARWDGTSWTAPNGGMSRADNIARVSAMLVFDDGSGPTLYAGGQFDHAGGVEAANLARWDGESWAPVGGGVVGSVDAMAVADFGDGPRLVVGGYLVQAGDTTAHNIAIWDGASWSEPGGGTEPGVTSLAVYDSGNGPKLYVGGNFKKAGGISASGIAMWDGLAWHALGSGLNSPNQNLAYADSMLVYDDGTGPALYIGGQFATANGLKANNIARYSGQGWSVLGTGVSNGPELIAQVHSLLAVTRPEGSGLAVGGNFELAGGEGINNIALWTAGAWSDWTDPEGQGVGGTTYALTTFDDGSGEALYVGGQFTKAGLVTASKIARWDGQGWSPVGTGFAEQFVSAFGQFDEGDGLRLFAGGNFDHAGAVKTEHIARWDGTKWSQVGPGLQSGYPAAMHIFDDGSGPALYVGGGFLQAGQTVLKGIARWDGAKFTPVGGGLNSWCGCLHAFDDGTGPALYAGGGFIEAGGVLSPYISRWSGSEWQAIGADGVVSDMAIFDDGEGASLYAGGQFTSVAGVGARGLARWNGQSWTEVGGGVGGRVDELQVFNDGSGLALFVAGKFTEAGGITVRNLARWDGTEWSAVGSGVVPIVVSDMMPFTDDDGTALYVTGAFESEDGLPPASISRWGCQGAPPCYADLDRSGALDLFDFLAFVNLFNASDPGADCDASGAHDLFDFLCFVNAYNAGC